MKQLAALVVLVLFAPPSYAEDAKAEAKARVARATELYNESKFREALDALQSAYALDPQPALLYAMGQVYVNLGDCAQAIVFYQRFLASKPSAARAALASEAIETCKTSPPPPLEDKSAGARPAIILAPPPSVDVAPPPPPAPQAPEHSADGRAWYADPVAGGLVGGGVVAGAVGLVLYRGAVADRDRASAAGSYEAYADAIDRVHRKRAYAVGFGVGGAVLAVAGVLRFALSDREASEVRIQPKADGGAVSWVGSF